MSVVVTRCMAPLTIHRSPPRLAPCPAEPSSSSTPIPTTRRSSPAARWRGWPTAGWRVVLVLATAGEQGAASQRLIGPEVTAGRPADGRDRPRRPTSSGVAAGGVPRLPRLRGCDGDPADACAGSVAGRRDAERAAADLAGILAEERCRRRWSATTPAGSTATSTTSRSTGWALGPPQPSRRADRVYESTVDREYLHFVETAPRRRGHAIADTEPEHSAESAGPRRRRPSACRRCEVRLHRRRAARSCP